ncbi:Holliday junction branch migration protein RuvA [Paenibacillus sp. 32O-W]|uniref:Holliday junction branch migration protein RuvA n=1 Tax=Paenibacillus sp. 32O-W TaxID=1695218 RepID=UPI0011A4F8FD|nr:Holliday junction branch migration protein RuvA [Paenibacillus sp. 32O-W]
MIDFLRGQLVHREKDYAVLDVQGVGYQVYCANPYALGGHSGEPVTLFTHQHVREDAILLFGFATREEQSLFRRLIEVNGIGPKVAIGILSAGQPEAVITAICQENIAFLTKLPGIGKKTAQRLILDLKDKLGDLTAGWSHADLASSAGSRPMSGLSASEEEAKQALMALGYSEAEIDRVWPAVKERAADSDPVDTVVKTALQLLFQG